MFMGLMAMAFVVDVLVTACCIYIATKLAFLEAKLSTLFAIVVIVSLLSLIPYAGWFIGLCVFVFLLMRATGANLVQCIMVVLLTRVIALAAVFFIQRMGQP
jgi:hypothetical protein